MGNHFYAMLQRMKHVYRWGLMRNSFHENLAEHSFDVAVIAHALAVIGNQRFSQHYDLTRVAVLALFHDASEILTGDLPTPIKYHNPTIEKVYHQLEMLANQQLLTMLPHDLVEAYRPFFEKQPQDEPLWKLIKMADKISALIKCIQEENAGNHEFFSAKKSLFTTLQQADCPESSAFLKEFLHEFSKTLDQQHTLNP